MSRYATICLNIWESTHTHFKRIGSLCRHVYEDRQQEQKNKRFINVHAERIVIKAQLLVHLCSGDELRQHKRPSSKRSFDDINNAAREKILRTPPASSGKIVKCRICFEKTLNLNQCPFVSKTADYVQKRESNSQSLAVLSDRYSFVFAVVVEAH